MSNATSKIKITRMSINNPNNNPYISHCFKIVWLKEGSAIWNIAGDVQKVRQNDIALINNEATRIIERITSNHSLDFLILEFEPQFLFEFQLLHLFPQRNSGFSHRIIRNDNSIIKLLEQIEWEDRAQQNYCQVIIASCVTQLLAVAARKLNITNQNSVRVTTQMKTVLSYIDEHYTEQITLTDLAKLANMSNTAFSKYFSRCNGIGPIQYIKRKRIEHAIQLLKYTERTILDIALECGFHNISNFYKSFKDLTLKAPTDYRSLVVE